MREQVEVRTVDMEMIARPPVCACACDASALVAGSADWRISAHSIYGEKSCKNDALLAIWPGLGIASSTGTRISSCDPFGSRSRISSGTRHTMLCYADADVTRTSNSTIGEIAAATIHAIGRPIPTFETLGSSHLLFVVEIPSAL
jgi:hypothetical protein